MTKPKLTKEAILRLLEELRSLAPKRPLTYGESIQVARRQAACLRRWLKALDQPDLNLIWLFEQLAVPVTLVPSYTIGEESGYTTNAVNGHLEIFLNQSEPRLRQRFSLLHEWKHAIDFENAAILHSRLGSGDAERQGRQIELIANEFAAHVLMPTHLVKRVWFRSQNLPLAASVFNVSLEAMKTRLEKLNLIGEPPERPHGYFRRSGNLVLPPDPEPYGLAA